MGVPRDDLLLLMRALKRGFADFKSARKALARQASKPITLLEALHLPSSDAEALGSDRSTPDPIQDRPLLDELRRVLIEDEHLTSADWDKFAGSISRPSQRHGWSALPVPQEFDGTTLQWELARRERGVVYRAKDREGRDVAVKVFRADVAVAASVPRVAGLAYVVEPFIEGESLEARRPSARRSAEAVAKAAEQLRDRSHGALHPARILLRKDDSVGVAGFGSATAAPPSARAQAYGPGDVRALGAILFEMLTGAAPSGETSPAARSKDVDPRLDAVVASALTGGYPSTGALADDLGRWLRNEPVTARKGSGSTASSSAGGAKSRWVWAAAAAVPVVAAAAWLLRPTPEAPPGAETPSTSRVASPEPSKAAPAVKPPSPRAVAAAPAKPLTPEEEQKLYDLCFEAQQRGDGDRVVALANEAVLRGTKRNWPYFHLAHAFIGRDELDKALEYETRGLEGAPADRDLLELRAQTRAFRGETRKALAEFEDLYGLKFADLNPQIRKLTQQVEAAEGDPKERARARLLRGVFYQLKRNPEFAAVDFGAAIDGGLRRALTWRAFAHKSAGESAKSVEDAKAYLREFPNDFGSEDAKVLAGEKAN